MDKKTLTYITGFTAVLALALAVYVFSGLFLKKTAAPTPPPQAQDKEVVFPKKTPSFTFSPQEPESARVFTTPAPESQTETNQNQHPPQLINIQITSSKFVPDTVEIQKGDVISWTNNDTRPHKIIGKSWRSGVIQPERVFSQQFDVSGNYQYYTEADPSITGTVTVK